MIKIAKADQDKALCCLQNGTIDAALLSSTNLPDEIIGSMVDHGILDCIRKAFPDRRKHNRVVPIEQFVLQGVAAKMKGCHALSAIPTAISDHILLTKLGFSMIDTDGDVIRGLRSEGTIRHFIEMYGSDELIQNYNVLVQDHIMSELDISCNIHILDTTDFYVPLDNDNYEGAEIGVDKDGKPARGYRIATLRGLYDYTGIFEEIKLGSLKNHDLELSKNIIYHSPVLKQGDILIADKGFLSREVASYLKINRGVNICIPLRKNMDAYDLAVSIAKEQNIWRVHPNKKRSRQRVAFVPEVGQYWSDRKDNNEIELNSAVVWDTVTDNYFVFVTTDTTLSMDQIIKIYELRSEIEEDYRQVKDAWRLDNTTSTSASVNAFHVFLAFLAYLLFRLYTTFPEGEKYAGKSLPSEIQKFEPEIEAVVVIYAGDIFGVFDLFEIMEIYADCNEQTREMLKPILKHLGRRRFY